MRRERALKVILVLVGLLFSAGIYPDSLWNANKSDYGTGIFTPRNIIEHLDADSFTRECVREVECPTCHAAPGNPCIAVSAIVLTMVISSFRAMGI